MIRALVIPAEGPIEEVDLDDSNLSQLKQLQGFVGGDIEALPVPGVLANSDYVTGYVNGDGKFDPDCKPNMRATDFMVPGLGLFAGDYIAGTFVLVGFDPETGEHTEQLPVAVVRRVRLIEGEAS